MGFPLSKKIHHLAMVATARERKESLHFLDSLVARAY